MTKVRLTLDVEDFEVIPDNQPATGIPVILGTPQVGEQLSVDVTAIADPDGLGPFSYVWMINEQGTWVDVATTPSFTPATEDIGDTLAVMVVFTDQAGNAESATSDPVGPIQEAPNQPATGQPVILGSPQEGQTLTVDTSGIADPDGLGNFSYVWEVSDNGTDWNLSGFMGDTVALDATFVGKRVRASVAFNDGRGFSEIVYSDPIGPVTGIVLGGTVYADIVDLGLDTNLVLCYDFENVSPTQDIFDLSPNANDAVLGSTDASEVEDPAYSGGLVFDGSSWVSGPAPLLDAHLDNATFSLQVSLDYTPGGGGALVWNGVRVDRNMVHLSVGSDGKLGFARAHQTGAATLYNSTAALVAGNNTVTLSVDEAAGQATLLVNDVTEVFSLDYPGASTAQATKFNIGCREDGTSIVLDGATIKSVSMWSTSEDLNPLMTRLAERYGHAGPNQPPVSGDAWTPEALDERMWLWWRARDLADGPVTTWPVWLYGREATLTGGSPTKMGDYVAFLPSDTMEAPLERWACAAHKSMMCVFRWHGGDGDFYAANGRGGAYRSRQGALKIENNQIVSQFSTVSSKHDIAHPINAGQWHIVHARWHCKDDEIQAKFFGSIDGGPETELSGDFVMGLHKDNDKSYLGGLDIDIRDMMVINIDLSEAERDKLIGWASHEYGIPIDPSHPYAANPPVKEPTDWVVNYNEDPLNEWQALEDAFETGSIESNLGTDLNLSDWAPTRVMQGNTMVVADQEHAGIADWYCPTHPAGSGGASPSRFGPDQEIYYVRNNETLLDTWGNPVPNLTGFDLTCRRAPSEWRGGVLASLNLAGKGWTVKPPFFVEVVWRSSSFLANDGTNKPMGTWQAPIWFVSADFVRGVSIPYSEIDPIEIYGIDEYDKGATRHSQAVHRHNPRRNVPGLGRVNDDDHGSNWVWLVNHPLVWPNYSGTLFDLQQHTTTFGMYDGWAYNYHDGKELGRWEYLDEHDRDWMAIIDNGIRAQDTGLTDNSTVSHLLIESVTVFGPA